MTNLVKLARSFGGGEWLFEREGVYFRLTRADIEWLDAATRGAGEPPAMHEWHNVDDVVKLRNLRKALVMAYDLLLDQQRPDLAQEAQIQAVLDGGSDEPECHADVRYTGELGPATCGLCGQRIPERRALKAPATR